MPAYNPLDTTFQLYGGRPYDKEFQNNPRRV